MSTIQLFGTVGTDFKSKDVADELAAAIGEVTVQINSGGGSFFEDVAIYHLLQRHGVGVEVMSAALSAGAVIAMSGKRIRMASGALLMIHSPFNSSGGTVREHQADIEMLKRAEQSTIDIFSARTRLSRQNIADMMKAETWMSATEAIEMGFADAFIESTIGIAASFNSWSAVVDHVQAEQQKKTRLKASRSVAAAEAKRRYPGLHRNYINLVNERT